ncbi:succinate dehydrogenase, hydrophobic membrane anchor protein [Amaricoccus sp.]|uniref:succinate dehydrogenase, hydrophobic membrane anchor protein n=1 Tax=Amaricoccus sp. TaxID=1872485 RepID=UPI001D8208EB|nr:succinate dehydrogenase, hydrophobic membrane anchor protein [Amaricoccus sp.]MCB1371686.1 succinate dehydrogenase, hydrophobic membrane anchor protein [Paracoccaceae bacterium]MCB1403817.1 succinate dehydrogenase, hydrophobic membrane anchor protein [Paracoccaceae bacterium]HRW17048.1 succinate dehydrogenase, hydrophobic membrane anchor protein [Amaricoccus sp.]
MGYRTDRQRAVGLGAAGEGTGHWWNQRLTSLALLLLTPFFVFPFAATLGADFETARATYADPFNALVAILFLLVAFAHLQQGVQVVVEDYVHGRALRTALLLANLLICWALALAGIFAIAKIAFTSAGS